MITFLGYIDRPEELLRGKRRCLFGCDDADDIANLPTTGAFTLADGSSTAVPAPWSMAFVRGGHAQILGSDGTWSSWCPEDEETPEDADADADA